MYFDDFLLGFLVCAMISGILGAWYIDYVKKEESLQRQQMAIEMVRNLDAPKLRHLLGTVRRPSRWSQRFCMHLNAGLT